MALITSSRKKRKDNSTGPILSLGSAMAGARKAQQAAKTEKEKNAAAEKKAFAEKNAAAEKKATDWLSVGPRKIEPSQLTSISLSNPVTNPTKDGATPVVGDATDVPLQSGQGMNQPPVNTNNLTIEALPQEGYKNIKIGPQLTSFTPTGPSSAQVQDYLGGLYQGAFNRDPEFNDDPSNTADYWVDAVSKGQHGDRDWKEWLSASIYGSDEKKGMSSGGSGTTSPAPSTASSNNYDDRFGSLAGDIQNLKDSMSEWQTNMQNNMWGNYSWGDPRTVGGVRTQNELPGWAPKKGGSSGFFGRGGNRFGLSSSALNI